MSDDMGPNRMAHLFPGRLLFVLEIGRIDPLQAFRHSDPDVRPSTERRAQRATGFESQSSLGRTVDHATLKTPCCYRCFSECPLWGEDSQIGPSNKALTRYNDIDPHHDLTNNPP